MQIKHDHHTLADEMQMFTLLWTLFKTSPTQSVKLNTGISTKDHTSTNDKLKLYRLFTSVFDVQLDDTQSSSQGITRERLGEILKKQTIELPNLIDLGMIPRIIVRELEILYNTPKKKIIAVPVLISYPPRNVNIDSFIDLVYKLSLSNVIVLIGERELSHKKKDVISIHEQLQQHCRSEDNVSSLMIDCSRIKYETIDDFFYDMNIIYHSNAVLTLGIGGIIDAAVLCCNATAKVYTIGTQLTPHSRFIWGNKHNSKLIKCRVFQVEDFIN